MKKILLATFKNNLLKEKFLNQGYNVVELSLPLSKNSIDQCIDAIDQEYKAIVELKDIYNMELFEYLVKILKNKSIKIIAIADDISIKIRSLLYASGIPDLLKFNGVKTLLDFIKLKNFQEENSLGKFIIFDDRENQISILKAIIERYNYTPLIINNQEELFQASRNSNAQSILLNIQTTKFDINVFAKKYYSDTEIKKIPLIAYTDENSNIFIEELVSGLRRLTSVVFLTGELYNFLIDTLFRWEICNTLKQFNNRADYEQMSDILKGPFCTVYKTILEDFFTYNNILEEENFDILKTYSEKLHRVMKKTESLRWMILERVKQSTCGLGA